MHLTREEEHVFDGEHGWAKQLCIKILVRLGELFNATKLIPIDSAHVSGVSYKTLGNEPIEFLRELADADARAKVRATLNPQSLDTCYLSKKLEKDLVEKQLLILQQFEKIGIAKSLTCTPYYLKPPECGSHVAWAESSAVVYANSVLGAWTNREGGPSALAAAIIGKTPNNGVHIPENREPSIRVSVETHMHDETDFGALGIHLGRELNNEIPLIEGLKMSSESGLKQLSAALASTGMTNMFRLEPNISRETERTERICVGGRELAKTAEDLTTAKTAKPDLVFIGCPHCSLNEIKEVAQRIHGKRVNPGLEFWVCTSPYVKKKAKVYVDEIEKSGGHVLAGVCTIVSWTEKLGIRTIMTNSAKTAYYAPTMNSAETILAPLETCLKTAVRG